MEINISGNYKDFKDLNQKLKEILKVDDKGRIGFQNIYYDSLVDLYIDLKRNPDKEFNYKEVYGLTLNQIIKHIEKELI